MSNTESNLSSRRQFIKGMGLAGAAGVIFSQSADAKTPTKAAKAKNMIFLVVDGMCNGTLGLAHHWNLRNKGKPLNWMQLYERPDLIRSFQDTASASSPVTDSAAASSAWGCGQRVENRSINTSAQGAALKPIFSYAKEAGKATGLVTTCTVTHATPAGFTANVAHRNMVDEIAEQYLQRGVDVILGGGMGIFKKTAEDGTVIDHVAKFEAGGYVVAQDRASLRVMAAAKKPLLGLFSDGHVPYAIDRKYDASLSGVPSLPEMFEAALKRLDGSEKGFVLQVEGGRVDHAGHANDPAAILHEQLEFDTCIPIALDYIEQHPDTLLIVTTDHGTGGCQLDGLGESYNESGPALERINQFKRSFEWLEKRLRKSGSFDAETFTMATGIVPSSDQIKMMEDAIRDPRIKYLSSAIAQIFESELTSLTATGWSSNNHTAENVELLAFGPGSAPIPAFIKNYELFGFMRNALGV